MIYYTPMTSAYVSGNYWVNNAYFGFVDPENDDYRLRPDSILISSGSTFQMGADNAYEPNGNNRSRLSSLDTNLATGDIERKPWDKEHPSVGAYQFQHTQNDMPNKLLPFGRERTLPVNKYDAEIEYLEATGTQWIDTGVSLSAGAFDMGVFFTDDPTLSGLNNGAIGVQGDATTGQTYQKRLAFYHAGNTLNYIIDRGTAGNRISRSGYSVNTGKLTFAIVLNTAKKLFICRANGVSLDYLRGRVYYFKLWDENDNLIRDFIPVRINQTGYLYDRVTESIFTNQGTGNFTLGPDKTS